MPLVYAVSSSLWSSGSTWNSGTVPTSSDDVYANNKAIIIDQNVSVRSITASASGSAVQGGSYTVSGSYTIQTTNGIIALANMFNVTNNAPNTVNIISDIQANLGVGQTGVYFSGTGPVNMTGNVIGIGTGNSSLITSNKSGTVTIVGNIIGNNSVGTPGVPLLINVTGSTNITGDLIFQSSFSNPLISLQNTAGSHSLSITGNIYSTATTNVLYNAIYLNGVSNKLTFVGTIYALYPTTTFPAILSNAASQSIDLTGNVYGSISANTIVANNPTSTVILRGTNLVNSFQNPGFSKMAVSSPSMTIVPSNQFKWTFYNVSSSQTTNLYVQGYVPDSPAQSDVRSGVTYLAGTLTGSLAMPLPNQVLPGVLVDNTTGSYAITTDAIAEAVWSKISANLTGSDSIGERLKNSATADTVSQQLQALTT